MLINMRLFFFLISCFFSFLCVVHSFVPFTFLIGQGSKILDNKYIDMTETTPLVDEIDFFEESTTNICESGLKLMQGINKQEVVIIPKKLKKKGLFERLFYFFK